MVIEHYHRCVIMSNEVMNVMNWMSVAKPFVSMGKMTPYIHQKCHQRQ